MPDLGRDNRGQTQVTAHRNTSGPSGTGSSDHGQLRELARPLRRGLGALRRRVRSLLLVLGVSRSVAVLASALLLFFVLDYTLRLPLWVRGCLLVATIAITAVVAIRRLLTPLARKITDETLASRVEAAHPELQDRLRSSLAFAGAPIDDPDNEDSPELMRTVVEQTIEQTRSLRFADVARSNIPIRWATAAAALAGILLLGSAARADLASTFIKRSLLLQDVSWPRRTTLSVVDMVPGVPRPVTRGRETTIVVRADGSIPDRVEFRYWESGSDRASGERVELTPAAEDRGRFAITLPVYKSYEFTIRGGDDDREPIYQIRALTPPSIDKLEMDVTYPSYLGKPMETLVGGDQRLPAGTKVSLRLKSTIPLAKAFMTFGANVPRTLEASAPDAFRIEFVAEKDTRFSLRLVGKSGEENDPGMDTFVIRVLKDQPPTVRIYTPSAHTNRVENGVVFIGFVARDDHRVGKVTFEYTVDSGRVSSAKPGSDEPKKHTIENGGTGADGIRFLLTPGLKPNQMRGVLAVDLARLRTDSGKKIERDAKVRYIFRVTDSAGVEQSARTDYLISIVSSENLQQDLDTDRTELRSAVLRAIDRLESAAQGAASIRDSLGDAVNLRRTAGRAQARQARLIDDLDSVSQRTRRLFNRRVFNRMDDPSAAEQLLPYFERHLLMPTRSVGEAYRGTLYRTLRLAVEDRQVRVGEAYDKLIRIADLADRLAVDHGPAAYRALGEISKNPKKSPDAALKTAAEEYTLLRDGLSTLLRWMKQWQNFEEFVRGFRSLRDSQERVVNEIKDLDEESK